MSHSRRDFLASSASAALGLAFGRPLLAFAQAAQQPLPHTDHTGQIGDVLTALETGSAPAVGGEDGRNAIEVVTAIYEAAIERRTVALPLAHDDPYYRSGTLVERAPRFFSKTASVPDQDGFVTLSDH